MTEMSNFGIGDILSVELIEGKLVVAYRRPGPVLDCLPPIYTTFRRREVWTLEESAEWTETFSPRRGGWAEDERDIANDATAAPRGEQ
jgi:hypothetical protein